MNSENELRNIWGGTESGERRSQIYCKNTCFSCPNLSSFPLHTFLAILVNHTYEFRHSIPFDFDDLNTSSFRRPRDFFFHNAVSLFLLYISSPLNPLLGESSSCFLYAVRHAYVHAAENKLIEKKPWEMGIWGEVKCLEQEKRRLIF